MVATMAHSPAVLGGYLDLNRHTKRAKLNRRTGELISIAVQTRLGCSRCLEAHEGAARGLDVDEEDIVLARAGTARTPADAAAVAFGLRCYTRPTDVTDEEIEGLRAAGFSDREIADVVAIVTINVLTGTFNLVSGLSSPVAPETA
jgi:AhpD family alkylhydroperoxidase